jgi:dephospho-CoA kinase
MAFRYAVALTGGIATGKTTVAKMFFQDKFKIIDADRVAHQMLDRYANQVAEIFGSDILDEYGKVDRAKLGAIVFADEDRKDELEDLLHPPIREEILIMANELDKEIRPYIVDIPLFFEGGGYDIDKVIVVYAPQELQLQRIMARDNLSKNEAMQRINSQLPIDHKKPLATYLIDNSSTMEHLISQYNSVRDQIIGEFL